jgi:hypothetical protein
MFHLRLIPLLCLFALAGPPAALAQRYPDNDSAGIAGTVPNSYVIAWRAFDHAVGYEYVLSDNPLCFTGCAGDTREAFVRDTVAIAYDLQINHRYYWILRRHLANGDTSLWSLIYSFTTGETDFNRQMIVPAPNPIAERQIRLRLDWAQNPRANRVTLTLLSPSGQQLREETFQAGRAYIRYDMIEWPAADLAPGRYLLRADIIEREQPITDTYWLTIIVP